MVIKRGSDGKYYIAPSPPSFYKSKPAAPTSSGGGGSSGGSSGGTTEQQLIDAGREAGKEYLRNNPDAFGGGIDAETGIRYSDGGTRVSVLSEAEKQANNFNPNTIANIQNVANVAAAENTILAIDQNRATSKALNLPPVNPALAGIIDNYRVNNQNKIKSTINPDPKAVADAGFRGDISASDTIAAQTKVLRDRIKETAENDIRQYSERIGEENQRTYSDILAAEERNLNNRFNDIQNRIDNGGDYDKAVREFNLVKAAADKRLKAEAEKLDKQAQAKLDGYAKEWSATRGAAMENAAGLVLRSTERLIRVSPTQLGKKYKAAILPGAVAGGGVTAIVRTTGLTLSKGVGLGLTAGAAGLSVGAGFVTAGIDVAKGDLARDEYLTEAGTRSVEGGVSFLGGFSGAVAGAAVVNTGFNLIQTGNIRGIKPLERELARQAYEKNGLKSRVISGKVTERSIKKLNIDGNGKNALMKEVKSGNIIRKTTYTPETKGLSSAEIKALGKYNVKIEVYSSIDNSGKVVRTIEVARITGKAPITRIYRGGDEVISAGAGTTKAGRVNLIRSSVKTQGLGFRDRLTLSGQTKGRINELSFERVQGRGGVATKGGFRLEAGAGKSTSFYRYNPQTKILDLVPRTSQGSTSIFSKQTGNILNVKAKGGITTQTRTQTFRDIFGTGTARNVGTPSAPQSNIFLDSPPKSFSSGSSGGSSGGSSFGSGSGGQIFSTTTKGGGGQIFSNKLSFNGGGSLGLNVVSSSAQSSGLGIITTTPTTTTTSVVAPAFIATGTKTKLFQTFAQPKVENKQIIKTKESQLFSQNLSPFQSNSLFSGNRGRSAPIQLTKPIQKPTTKPSPIFSPAPTPQPLSNLPNLAGLGGFGFGFGGGAVKRLRVGGGGIGRRERGGLFGKTRYSASLGSVLTGYSKKGDARSLSKQTFSGIGLRPILLNGDKKKKKTKKKKKK